MVALQRPPDYQVFGAASGLGRSIFAAGQPSSFRPTTDRGCEAAIQGAAAHRRIRRRDQGRAVGDESASRNRKFESTSLRRRVVRTIGSARDFGTSPKARCCDRNNDLALRLGRDPCRDDVVRAERRRKVREVRRTRRNTPPLRCRTGSNRLGRAAEMLAVHHPKRRFRADRASR